MKRNSYQDIYVPDEHLRAIKKIILAFVPDIEVRSFGSRKQGVDHADLHIVLIGEEQTNQITLIKLREVLDKSGLPFHIEVLDFYILSDEFKKVVKEEYDIIQEARERD